MVIKTAYVQYAVITNYTLQIINYPYKALRVLSLERQAALSGIHRNVGLADEGARKQLFGELVFKFGLDSPL